MATEIENNGGSKTAHSSGSESGAAAGYLPERDSDRTKLLRIAAALARGDKMISPFREDNPKTTPRSILRKAADQQDALCNWASELAGIARRIEPTADNGPVSRRTSND